ncbi:hypothetical protein FACS189468_9430 [Spirochaetia bacterium]|nr:hypothetical protein FACS189468_9430 [Spirochaetia bacterium]
MVLTLTGASATLPAAKIAFSATGTAAKVVLKEKDTSSFAAGKLVTGATTGPDLVATSAAALIANGAAGVFETVVGDDGKITGHLAKFAAAAVKSLAGSATSGDLSITGYVSASKLDAASTFSQSTN